MFASMPLFAAISPATRGLLTAGGIVVLSVVAGSIIDRVVAGALRKLASATSGQLDDIVVASFKGVGRWVFLLAGLYIAIPYLPLAAHIDKQVTNGARIAVMLLTIFVAARFATGITVHYAYKVVPTSVSLAKVIVNVAVFTIGLLVIFQTMGIQITPVITALGVGGLAVALALQPTLANFFAGIQLLALREINAGDYIQLQGGPEGWVQDIGWRSTTLRMLKNNLVIIPNTKMTDAIVTNYALPNAPFGVLLGVGVSYASDLEKVERVSIEVAKEVIQRVDGTVKDFQPVVRFNTFGDSSINFNLIVQCNDFPAQYLTAHELVKALHKRFNQEGINIPFPIRTVYLKNETAS